MNRVAQYLLIAAVAGGAATSGYLVQRSGSPTDPASAGVPADAGEILLAMTLPDSLGTEHPLSQWRGKVLVANFWATWCPPCRKEIPDFAAVSVKYADAPVQFVGISIDTAENVRGFAEEFDVPYPLLIGGGEALNAASRLGNASRALPFTVILDAEGQIAHIKLGTLNEHELEGKIRALLAR